MGQYYTPYVQRGRKIKTYYSHRYGNGLKLMEHSYIGNNFVNAVCNEIFDAPAHVVWCGDYAEVEDFKNTKENRAKRIIAKCEKNYDMVKDGNEVFGWDNKEYFLINVTKKQYIAIDNEEGSWGAKIHPLPLLTAVGNGKGGGDYRGINEEQVGIWADDVLYITDNPPKDYGRIEIPFYEE